MCIWPLFSGMNLEFISPSISVLFLFSHIFVG